MKEDTYSFDIGPMGAIGEQGSLLLRVNRYCPWNRCLFCSAYKGNRFEYRSTDEVKRDIDVIKFLATEIEAAFANLGWANQVNDEVIWTTMQNHPEIYSNDSIGDELSELRYSSLRNVGNWLKYGAKTVFLQDADALIMRIPELLEVIMYLKSSFPSIERITCYARSKTCARKSVEELKALHQAGLSRLLVGIESGYDTLLDYMQKGVTAQDHSEGCRKVIESGITLVTFVMPGLGSKRWTEGHVQETVRVLNEVRPHLVRIRSLAIQEASPLYEKWKSGEFKPPTDDEMIDEIEQLINHLNFNCDIEAGQLTNVLFEIRGHLPQDKDELLGIIQRYKAMPPRGKADFRLQRYLQYYIPYLKDKEKLNNQLLQLIEEAEESLTKYSPEAEQKVEQAILAIKQKGIP